MAYLLRCVLRMGSRTEGLPGARSFWIGRILRYGSSVLRTIAYCAAEAQAREWIWMCCALRIAHCAYCVSRTWEILDMMRVYSYTRTQISVLEYTVPHPCRPAPVCVGPISCTVKIEFAS